jgi:hypothetical protein
LYFVSGGSTSRFSDRGEAAGAGSLEFTNKFRPVHRFAPTSLRINNTDPKFTLDVTGSGRIMGAVIIGAGTPTNMIDMGSGTLTYTAIAAQTCQERLLP